MRNVYRLLGLALLFAAIGCSLTDRAGELEEACEFAHKKLKPVIGGHLSKSFGDFSYTDGGQQYHGCIIKLTGDKTKVSGNYSSNIFYPSEDSQLYKQGWRADMQADGPDGTSFVIIKGNVFCIVEEMWDGCDDSDPEYIPLPDFEVTVKCSKLKNHSNP